MKAVLFLFLMLFPFFCYTGLFAQGTLEQQLDQLLEEELKADAPEVAVLVAKEGKVVYRKAIGMADLELNISLQPEHVFHIASITKQFTAVAIMKLQEEGKLSVKDPLTRFLPDYPTPGNEILIEHLLSHTSGIANLARMPSFDMIGREDKSVQEVIDILKNEPMLSVPGEVFEYNNGGYYLLGAIIEKVSGKSYAEYVEEVFFQPLGMNHSDFMNYEKIIPLQASGYQERNGQYQNAPYISPTLPFSAGGLISTLDDLLKWNEGLQKGILLNEQSLQQLFTPYSLKNGEQINYAYGWYTGTLQGSRILEHDGLIPGFSSQGIYLPEEKVYVIVLTNCSNLDPISMGYRIAGMSIGKPFPIEAIALEEEQLKNYTGIYEFEEGYHYKVVLENGQLHADRNGALRTTIHPYQTDQFFVEGTLSSYHFEKDDTGKIIALMIQDKRGAELRAIRRNTLPKTVLQLQENRLQAYVGTYTIGPGMVVTFTVEDGCLMGEPKNASKEKLYPEGDDKFALKRIRANIEFHRENDQVIGLTFRQGDTKMTGKKI